MPKNTQNLVMMIQKPTTAYDLSSDVGNMCINRLCIDEDAGFELSGVHYQEEIDTQRISDDTVVTTVQARVFLEKIFSITIPCYGQGILVYFM